ncbi:MMPL family transporter [Nocardioides euryhalodurans]|nr:MMPL family transporter [Nocardioides euryhalodurans]
MNATLERLARFAVLHPWRTIAAWALVLGAVIGLATTLGGPAQEDWDIPDAPAQVGIDQLREHLPGYGNASAQVVVHDDVPIPPSVLAGLGADLAGLEHVDSLLPTRVSEDGRTALLVVQYDVPVTHSDVYQDIGPLEDTITPYEDDGLQIELGGELPSTAVGTIEGKGELVGVVAALVILLLLFRSVVAAGLPILVALGGLAIGLTGVTVLCGLMSVSPTAPTVASMVGLGVGLDYALLLLVRILDNLGTGEELVDAAAGAARTAGRSVVLAGTTVLVSLMGLRFSGLNTFAAFGFATAIAVISVVFSVLVLVPALSSLCRRRLRPRTARPGRTTSARTGHRAERWAHAVARRPLTWGLVAATVLLALAAPVVDLRTWPGSGADEATSNQLRRSHDLVTDGFGRGAASPLLVVIDTQRLGQADVTDVLATLRTDPGITTVVEPVDSPDGALAVVQVESSYVANDERTGALIERLRSDLPEGVEVTGGLAVYSDIVDLLAVRLWLVIGFVVGISMVMLTLMFRAPVVALKAAVMNLLSVGAAYGILVAVFQWGWGAGLLGVDHTLPVSSWLPILMFTILFGLSMDYEVFLLSRIREDYVRTGDAVGSVARGLASTSSVITTAAAVMVMVFVGFAAESGVFFKMMGLGMAVAIALDATLVRMVLVPATMALLGHRNWWIPAWLDRVLPRIDVDVEVGRAAQERAGEPEPAAEPVELVRR